MIGVARAPRFRRGPGTGGHDTGRARKRFSLQVPEGDTQDRHVRDHRGFIRYENPKVVTGSVVVHDGRVLLCRVAIPLRIGYWTLPAGYMEPHETTEESARCEAFEEACAAIEIETLLAVYSISRLSQVQVIYRARLIDSDIRPGPESREVVLFGWDDIPCSLGRPRLSERTLGADPATHGRTSRRVRAIRQPRRRDQ